MKKVLPILMALMLGLSPASFAATVVLDDAQMAGITAGDWVVIDPSTQEVFDVYHSNNTLDLEDESQMNIQAVNNANAVDSAIASQTNIASVTGGEPSTNVAINGTNEANIINYNPSDAGSTFENHSKSISKFSESREDFSLDEYESWKSTYTSNFKLDETLDIVETLNIAAALAIVSSEECKNCEKDFALAAAFLLDYDYDLDYDLHITKDKSASKEALKLLKITKSSSEFSKFSKEESSESGSEWRKNLSENNHLDLEDTSQKAIQAVSNLNAVGSGAAMQANIASNVGVSGTITHLNVASVANGL